MYFVSECRASFREVRISDLDFADDTAIFAGTLGAKTGALETLSEESELLGLRISWVKTKIQHRGKIMDAGSCRVASENVEVVEKLAYLGTTSLRALQRSNLASPSSDELAEQDCMALTTSDQVVGPSLADSLSGHASPTLLLCYEPC